jgi:hypothetical protein
VWADNELSFDIFPHVDRTDVVPPSAVYELCSRCSDPKLGIFSHQFVFERHLADGGSNNCGVCWILTEDKVQNRYVRVDSYLASQASGPPLFSIIVGPGISSAPNNIQRGFPRMPHGGSEAEYVILKQWIKNCETYHELCKKKRGMKAQLPTRLIYVGKDKSSMKLVCSKSVSPRPIYVALTHRWGYPEGAKQFSLTPENIGDLMKTIDETKMPKTFRDAVHVTRGLDIEYLWIDFSVHQAGRVGRSRERQI